MERRNRRISHSRCHCSRDHRNPGTPSDRPRMDVFPQISSSRSRHLGGNNKANIASRPTMTVQGQDYQAGARLIRRVRTTTGYRQAALPRRHTERNYEVESTLLEQLLIPWWKPVVYVATLVIAAVTIRVSIKLDFNEWQKNRQRERRTKEQQKAAERCSHVWTLYPQSQYSICNICQVLHSTSTLMALRGSPDIVIAGERYGMEIKADAGALIAMDPYGRRKRK